MGHRARGPVLRFPNARCHSCNTAAAVFRFTRWRGSGRHCCSTSVHVHVHMTFFPWAPPAPLPCVCVLLRTLVVAVVPSLHPRFGGFESPPEHGLPGPWLSHAGPHLLMGPAPGQMAPWGYMPDRAGLMHMGGQAEAGGIRGPAPRVESLAPDMLAFATPAERRHIIGERLYSLIHHTQPGLAGKITGMLLECMDISELLHLIESPESLTLRLSEVVEAHKRQGL
jgi:hypothetical protein